MTTLAHSITDEQQAHTVYLQLRAQLYPVYAQWRAQADRVLEQQLAAAG
jgi:hypothetical protein